MVELVNKGVVVLDWLNNLLVIKLVDVMNEGIRFNLLFYVKIGEYLLIESRSFEGFLNRLGECMNLGKVY